MTEADVGHILTFRGGRASAWCGASAGRFETHHEIKRGKVACAPCLTAYGAWRNRCREVGVDRANREMRMTRDSLYELRAAADGTEVMAGGWRP